MLAWKHAGQLDARIRMACVACDMWQWAAERSVWACGCPQAKLSALPNWGAKKSATLLAALEASKAAPTHLWMHGLGIEGVGVQTAKDLAK